MKLHHLRNATLIIETQEKFILVDPMLGKKATLSPFTLFRFKPRKNPLVDLPSNSHSILEKVTHCLVTHLHPDHLDKDAESFLKQKNIPVICSKNDEKTLQKRGLNIAESLDFWKEHDFLEGKIIGIPAIHGYGFIAKPMGNVMGFYLKFPNEKSIYISADTIYTQDVDRVLRELKPEISVLACGSAQLDFGKPLLMTMEDILKFIKNAPGKVFANHLEALNHCPTTRMQLRNALKNHQLQEKVFIPEDGENVIF
ncbi:MBL fold metallo-hydrolase [Paenimyroides aestuarii]|uniref:MBL fold metallo-hydrolase n=1 Tax=Paenimyroides aestuarii TaxID=2968490 RepID=A0ABY5NR18_9FLAO|nr:MBL fold metallo-hydrolase [Paenimyroides aestuarii]UUV20929.1 MBL fold metallo-hydrolase [Paenimyroides aestuarii]